MPDDPITRLSRTLKVAPGEFAVLRSYPDEQLSVLAGAVERAVTVQREEIDASLEGALGFIPRPLRGRARKLLFPGGQ